MGKIRKYYFFRASQCKSFYLSRRSSQYDWIRIPRSTNCGYPHFRRPKDEHRQSCQTRLRSFTSIPRPQRAISERSTQWSLVQSKVRVSLSPPSPDQNQTSNSSRYYRTAQTKSKIMRDQPIQPMEKAIFWIEYVLRHGPCSHLRTAALKLSWHEYFLLDVLSILFVPASIAAAFMAVILVRRFRNGGRKQENQDKKNK